MNIKRKGIVMIDKKQNGEELFLIDNEDLTENLSTDTKNIKPEEEVQLTSNLNLNNRRKKSSLKKQNRKSLLYLTDSQSYYT